MIQTTRDRWVDAKAYVAYMSLIGIPAKLIPSDADDKHVLEVNEVKIEFNGTSCALKEQYLLQEYTIGHQLRKAITKFDDAMYEHAIKATKNFLSDNSYYHLSLLSNQTHYSPVDCLRYLFRPIPVMFEKSDPEGNTVMMRVVKCWNEITKTDETGKPVMEEIIEPFTDWFKAFKLTTSQKNSSGYSVHTTAFAMALFRCVHKDTEELRNTLATRVYKNKTPK
jgi:hypothetical protein